MSTNQTTAGEVIRRKFLGYPSAALRIGKALGGDVKRAAIGVHLAMFAMAVFGGVETAFANPIYSFTTIDGPGAHDTNAYGINNSGQIVGVFDDISHGFLYTGGNFTILDGPSESRAMYNEANGINNSGQIVGVFSLRGDVDGYLYTDGIFTTIDVPGAKNTFAQGINDSGQIVGYFGPLGGADTRLRVYRRELHHCQCPCPWGL
jgi:probable HAF family extracellular repeat protein